MNNIEWITANFMLKDLKWCGNDFIKSGLNLRLVQKLNHWLDPRLQSLEHLWILKIRAQNNEEGWRSAKTSLKN